MLPVGNICGTGVAMSLTSSIVRSGILSAVPVGRPTFPAGVHWRASVDFTAARNGGWPNCGGVRHLCAQRVAPHRLPNPSIEGRDSSPSVSHRRPILTFSDSFEFRDEFIELENTGKAASFLWHRVTAGIEGFPGLPCGLGIRNLGPVCSFGRTAFARRIERRSNTGTLVVILGCCENAPQLNTPSKARAREQ
jgi:hypothetical protein